MSSALGCDHLAFVQPMMRVINGWTAMFWGGCGAGCDRAARDSHTRDGCLPDGSAIERFSVSDPPLKRWMQPEAGGWRHFVFGGRIVVQTVACVTGHGIVCSLIRPDEHTGK